MLVSARLLLRRQRFFVTFDLLVFVPVPEPAVLRPVVTVLRLFESYSDPGDCDEHGQLQDCLCICLGTDRFVTNLEPKGKDGTESQSGPEPAQCEDQAIGKAR